MGTGYKKDGRQASNGKIDDTFFNHLFLFDKKGGGCDGYILQCEVGPTTLCASWADVLSFSSWSSLCPLCPLYCFSGWEGRRQEAEWEGACRVATSCHPLVQPYSMHWFSLPVLALSLCTHLPYAYWILALFCRPRSYLLAFSTSIIPFCSPCLVPLLLHSVVSSKIATTMMTIRCSSCYCCWC